MSDRLINELKAIVGTADVINAPDELLVYECDGLPHHKVMPRAVLFPESTEEVARVLKLLTAAGVPFTPRGAGTGVSGGALAKDQGIVIELARMRRLIKIDPALRTAVVETGMVNAQLSKAAAPYGLYYAPDPSSESTCTIGGNIAENAGGIHCLKSGVTVDHVLSVRAVLSDGEIVDLDTGRYSPGYDLAGLFVGSEGTFGIATEATVKLLPIPQAVRTILAEFPNVDDASRAVSAIIAAGLIPAALEMMDAQTIRAVEASVYAAGLPSDVGAALLIELDGLEAGLDEETSYAVSVCREHGARGVRMAADEADRKRIWQARKGAYGAMGRMSPDVMIQDAVVPRSKLPGVLSATYEIAAKYDLNVANVFHAGDGNLHPLIPFDARNKEQVARVTEAGREIMDVCVAAGGTITGEHGVGLDKIAYLPLIFSDDDMEIMLRVRSAFDPTGLCNPGKIIPVRRGCGETRAVAAKNRNAKIIEANVAPIDSVSVSLPKVNAVLSDPRTTIGEFDPERSLDRVASIVGRQNIEHHAQTGTCTAFPDSIEMASELLNLAHSETWPIVPAGSSSWLDVGNPMNGSALIVSTARLTNVLEYEPADLVITVEAGKTLSDLNSGLESQWLPLDPPEGDQATLGGLAATGASGPQSFGYGSPRYHIIGMRVALPDARVIKAGGRVVKNVAGYDLCKLFAGSFGTLGLILELTFKLRPRPAVQETVIVRSSKVKDLTSAATELLGSELLPVAVELTSTNASKYIDGHEYSLAVRFAGVSEAVAYQTRAAKTIFESFGLQATSIINDVELWQDLATMRKESYGGVSWRAFVPRNNIGTMIDAVSELFRDDNSFSWQASLGDGRLRVVHSKVEDADSMVRRIETLRKNAESLGGNLRIDKASTIFKQNIDVWGTPGNSVEVIRRLKQQIDPANRFSPGRFVAGI